MILKGSCNKYRKLESAALCGDLMLVLATTEKRNLLMFMYSKN